MSIGEWKVLVGIALGAIRLAFSHNCLQYFEQDYHCKSDQDSYDAYYEVSILY